MCQPGRPCYRTSGGDTTQGPTPHSAVPRKNRPGPNLTKNIYPKIFIRKYLSENIYPKIFIRKYLSENIYPKIFFEEYFSKNIFQKIFFRKNSHKIFVSNFFIINCISRYSDPKERGGREGQRESEMPEGRGGMQAGVGRREAGTEKAGVGKMGGTSGKRRAYHSPGRLPSRLARL